MELFVWLLLPVFVVFAVFWFVFDLKTQWRYRRMNTLQKIECFSAKINKESDLAEQKNLLAHLKTVAKKYKEEQEAIVHPQKNGKYQSFYIFLDIEQ